MRKTAGFQLIEVTIHYFLIPNSPEEMACWRKKSSVCLMDSRRGTTGFQPQYFMALRMLGLRCWQSW